MDVRTDRQTAAPVECQEQGTWEAVMGSQSGRCLGDASVQQV